MPREKGNHERCFWGLRGKIGQRVPCLVFFPISYISYTAVQTHVRLTRWEMRDRKKKERDRGGREGKREGRKEWGLEIKDENGEREERLE